MARKVLFASFLIVTSLAVNAYAGSIAFRAQETGGLLDSPVGLVNVSAVGTSDMSLRAVSTSKSLVLTSPSKGSDFNFTPGTMTVLGGSSTTSGPPVVNPPGTVPEPVALVLLGTGLAGIAATLRKRRSS